MSGTRIVVRTIPGTKDGSGAFMPETKDLSIDGLMKQGLEALHDVMRSCRQEAKGATPSRECVMNLRDCMAMLHQLKEKEQEILEGMSNEALEEVIKK